MHHGIRNINDLWKIQKKSDGADTANNIQGVRMIGAQSILLVSRIYGRLAIERGKYPVAIGDDFMLNMKFLPEPLTPLCRA